MEGVTQVHLPAKDLDAELVVHRIEDELFIEVYFDDGFVERKGTEQYQFMLDKDQKGRLLDLLMKDKVFMVNSFVFGPAANAEPQQRLPSIGDNWWVDKPEKFEATIIKTTDGGVWGDYAAKTIYGNFAINKKSWFIAKACLGEKVMVKPFPSVYMCVDIVRPIPLAEGCF